MWVVWGGFGGGGFVWMGWLVWVVSLSYERVISREIMKGVICLIINNVIFERDSRVVNLIR